MPTSTLASSLRDTISGMNRRLRKTIHTTESLSMTELASLSYLYPDNALSTTELASLVKVRMQSMSEVVIRLDGLGMVAKTPSVEDKRKSLVALTLKGREIVEQTQYERDEWLTQAIDNTLTDGEKETLQAAILLMKKLMIYE